MPQFTPTNNYPTSLDVTTGWVPDVADVGSTQMNATTSTPDGVAIRAMPQLITDLVNMGVQLETVVGIPGSAVTTSHDYRVSALEAFEFGRAGHYNQVVAAANSVSLNSVNRVRVRDEFFGAVVSNAPYVITTTSASVIQVDSASVANYNASGNRTFGAFRLQLGSVASGGASVRMSSPAFFVPGQGTFIMTAKMALSNLVNNTMFTQFGLQDVGTFANFINFIWQSGAWNGNTEAASTAHAVTFSGGPSISAYAFHYFTIYVSANGQTVTFYIDGTQVGTQTTAANIPTAAMNPYWTVNNSNLATNGLSPSYEMAVDDLAIDIIYT